MRLEEFFQKHARGAGVRVAEQFKRELQVVLGVPAPTRVTRGGRIVATIPAIPFAPPRTVTGRLRERITVVRTAHGARVVVWTPYGVPLERSTVRSGFPHKFVQVALERMGLEGRAS